MKLICSKCGAEEPNVVEFETEFKCYLCNATWPKEKRLTEEIKMQQGNKLEESV